jgi:putative FmdB family regulatory protein
MPMYEYRCTTCGTVFEQLRRLSEADKDVACPACESSSAERLISGFATSGSASASGGGGCGSGGGRGRFR